MIKSKTKRLFRSVSLPLLVCVLACLMLCLSPQAAHARATIDSPIAKLQSIDKVTARTLTFEVKTGSTVRFGSLYIKLRACRRAPDIEEPESAAFMQIWEVADEGTDREKANWIFSGWMFASSPGLSAMDHPIYDVWVLSCSENKVAKTEQDSMIGEALEGEGVVEDAQTPDEPAPNDIADKIAE